MEGRILDVTFGMGQPSSNPDDPPPIPVTYVHVEVERVLKGDSGAVLRVLLPGGPLDDETFISAVGVPLLALDDRVLFGTKTAVLTHGDDVVLPINWTSGLLVEDRSSSAAPLARDGQGRILGSQLAPVSASSIEPTAGECTESPQQCEPGFQAPLTWSELRDIAAIAAEGGE